MQSEERQTGRQTDGRRDWGRNFPPAGRPGSAHLGKYDETTMCNFLCFFSSLYLAAYRRHFAQCGLSLCAQRWPHRTATPPQPHPQSPVSNKTHYGYELYIGAVGKSSWFKSSGPLWIFASRQPDSVLIELLRNFSQHVSGISKRFSAVGVRQSSLDVFQAPTLKHSG